MNMAEGRGVDIKLGGVPLEKNNYEKVKRTWQTCCHQDRGHEARRIDNQRYEVPAGRQGDEARRSFMFAGGYSHESFCEQYD